MKVIRADPCSRGRNTGGGPRAKCSRDTSNMVNVGMDPQTSAELGNTSTSEDSSTRPGVSIMGDTGNSYLRRDPEVSTGAQTAATRLKGLVSGDDTASVRAKADAGLLSSRDEQSGQGIDVRKLGGVAGSQEMRSDESQVKDDAGKRIVETLLRTSNAVALAAAQPLGIQAPVDLIVEQDPIRVSGGLTNG